MEWVWSGRVWENILEREMGDEEKKEWKEEK